MPTVPRYVQTERPQGYQNVQPVAGGAEAMGRAMRGLGDALGGVGRDMWGIAIAERDKFDKAILQEKQTAYEDIMLTAQQRESERKGKNALGDDQGNQGVFDSISRIHKETAESCMQGLNERQKTMLGDYFDKRGRAFSSWGHEYEQREKGVYEKGQADAYQQSQILRALNNPGELQAAMGNYAQSILEFNRSRGIDDEATKLQIQAGWDKYAEAAAAKMITEGNVDGVAFMLAQNGQDLSPVMRTKVEAMLEKGIIDSVTNAYAAGENQRGKDICDKWLKGGAAKAAGLNGGIAAQTAQFQGRTVYGFGSRDPEKGSVDCSGWVGYALEKCSVKGYRGLTADKMVDKARRQGGAVSVQDLISHPRGGIVIGLDQGKKGWDAGRIDGIDHVVVTYEDPVTGRIMVSESSGRQGAAGSGVHGTPLDKWLSYHQRKGHKIFAGDISGQAQGAGLSSNTRDKLVTLRDQGDAVQMGQQLARDVISESKTMSEALEVINGIKSPKVQSMVRAQFGTEMKMKEYADKELVKEATEKATDFLQGIETKFDQEPAAATKELFDEVRRAENAALAGGKADKEYAKLLRKVYDGLGTGLARNTDPAVYNGFAERIGSGEITQEKQLAQDPRFMQMARKDREALKKMLGSAQKVDRDMLKKAFTDVFGESDANLDPTDKKIRNGTWKAMQQYAYEYFRETNAAGNPEAYRRIAEMFASSYVMPGLWDTTGTYGEFAADNNKDALPEISDAQKAAATKVFADQPKVAERYMKEAGQWKDDHGSLANTERVAEMMFWRSQNDAAMRSQYGPPKRPDNVPDKAKWGYSKTRNCFGWAWADGNEAKFEPYVYKAEKR